MANKGTFIAKIMNAEIIHHRFQQNNPKQAEIKIEFENEAGKGTSYIDLSVYSYISAGKNQGKRQFDVAYENLLIGLISAVLALGFSQTISYLISTHFFHITYQPFWGVCLLLMVGAAAVICMTGSMASVSVLLKKPVLFLRTQAEG